MREIDVSVLNDILPIPVPVSRHNGTGLSEPTVNPVRVCHSCGYTLEVYAIECPSCGVINLDKARRRHKGNRPTREILTEVVSENHNGKYQIFKNSDNSLSCTCLSFLFQRGIQNGVGFSICKHINRYLDDHPITGLNGETSPSEWQIAALKRLGIEVFEYLTNTQAYFIFYDLLNKQGVEYREYETLLKEYGNVNILPLYSFGVEFEGLVRDKEEFKRKLNEAGLSSVLTGYDHTPMNEWKVGSDGSVHPNFRRESEQNMQPIELVSPKLFGTDGFESIKKALTIWNEVGASVNISCGTHVHIDAWNWDKSHMIELSLIWAKIEQPVLWYLVSPSRRNGSYCKAVNREYIRRLATSPVSSLNRYYSLNLNAFSRHKTIEFRLHNGTLHPKKIIPWIIFLLKLTDAIKRGVTHRDIGTAVEGVFETIEMIFFSTSIIREAREYLSGRYTYWLEDSKRYPNHIPNIRTVNLEGIEEEIERAREESIRSNAWSRYRINRNIPLVQGDSNLPANAVRNLALMGCFIIE